MAKKDINPEIAREYFSYNEDTGQLSWRFAYRGKQPGDPAGSLHGKTGYMRVGLLGEKYLAHRVAWVIKHGGCSGIIDHKNGIRSDNRLSNLRDVTQTVNLQNIRKAPVTSTSKLLGAYKHKRTGLWIAKIRFRGDSVHIGVFKTAKEAHEAYVQTKRLLHEGCTI